MIKLIKEFLDSRELVLRVDDAKKYAKRFELYADGSYSYLLNCKWRVVKNGKILFRSTERPMSIDEDAYIFQTENQKWTLFVEGQVVIENADEIWRVRPGTFAYQINGREYTVKNIDKQS